jgi:transcriptional regulator with XRE-family HTH domain
MAALNLRKLRINKGLSRHALAQAAGVHHATIKRLEGGELPTARTAEAIASYFEIEATDLWPSLLEDRAAR